jgi:hypothetical protein
MGSQTLRAAAAWIELGKLPEVSRSTTDGVKMCEAWTRAWTGATAA